MGDRITDMRHRLFQWLYDYVWGQVSQGLDAELNPEPLAARATKELGFNVPTKAMQLTAKMLGVREILTEGLENDE